jgi:hypothetical protein
MRISIDNISYQNYKEKEESATWLTECIRPALRTKWMIFSGQ